jgi:hypothetical protein
MRESDITRAQIASAQNRDRIFLLWYLFVPVTFLVGVIGGGFLLLILREFYSIHFTLLITDVWVFGTGVLLLLIARRFLVRLAYHRSLRITPASVVKRDLWERKHPFLFGLMLAILPFCILLYFYIRW